MGGEVRPNPNTETVSSASINNANPTPPIVKREIRSAGTTNHRSSRAHATEDSASNTTAFAAADAGGDSLIDLQRNWDQNQDRPCATPKYWRI